MSKALKEAAQQMLQSVNEGGDPPKKLPGTDAPLSLQANERPESGSGPTVPTSKATPPGKTPPAPEEKKSVPKTVDMGKYSTNTSKTEPNRKLKDEVHTEEEDDELYEEFEVGELVEDDEGNIGQITSITEEGIEVDWEVLAEANDEDEEEDEEEQLDERSRDQVARRVAAIRGRNAIEYDDEDNVKKMDRAEDRVKKTQGKKGMDKVNRMTNKITFGKSRMFEEDEQYYEDDKKTVKESIEAHTQSIYDSLDFDMSQDVAAMFSGSDLSEEFKDKARTIFEAAVKSRVQTYAEQLDELYAEKLDESVEAVVESISESVEEYLDSAVQNWISENEIAIETNLRSELTEDFINGLRNLFIENYIDIPDEKLDVLEEMTYKVDELEDQLNEQIEKNMGLVKILKESRKEDILREKTQDMEDAQREKIYSLAENVEFKSEKAFEEAVKTLVESYFPSNRTKRGSSDLGDDDVSEVIVEDTNGTRIVEKKNVEEPSNDIMDMYARQIKRTL